MQFFLVLVAVLVATATAGSRLPVAALATNKAKINNKELVMKLRKLRGGGMTIGPLNAGLIYTYVPLNLCTNVFFNVTCILSSRDGVLITDNMLDVNGVFAGVYALQLLFGKAALNRRFYVDGVGHPKASFASNLLAFTMITQVLAGYFVSRDVPAFKATYGKIWTIGCLINMVNL